MSRVLVIPDPHLKIGVIEDGLELAEQYRADHVVLLGDYFDDWHAVPTQYFEMKDYLKKIMRRFDVITLIGNHELSYMGYPCSGHNRLMDATLSGFLKNDYRFLPCVGIDGVLYSHAGLTKGWAETNRLYTNNEFRFKVMKPIGAEFLEKKICGINHWGKFATVGPLRGGHEVPSPMWADLEELIEDAVPIKQVVGHTPVNQVECIGSCWFTDVFSNGNKCDEYLLVEDGKPKVVRKGV